MAIRKIEFQNKVGIDSIAVPEKNKITDTNINEIKAVVNNNAEELKDTNTMVGNFIDDAEDRLESVENASAEAVADVATLEGEVGALATDLQNLSQNTYTKTETNSLIGEEETARQNADTNLQNQIDAIVASSDVVDIVGTYQDLQNYDTSHLSDNDIVKVLQDSTHNNAVSYYRWKKHTSTWQYVGSEGPYYTKGETDNLLNDKVDKEAGKGLSQNDFTNTLKSKLDGIEAGAEVNIIETVKVNGTARPISNKSVDISVPTQTNQLENNSGFITNDVNDLTNYYKKTEVYTKSEVNTALSNKEDKSNKKSELNNNLTNDDYLGAKVVYDALQEKQSQIDSLEAENEQLWNDHPDITGTAGTDLTLQGTGDLKMKVDVGGNSTQVQYAGYNKFEPTLQNEGVDIDRNNVSVTLNGDEFTFTPTSTSFYFGIAVPDGTAYKNQFGKKINVTNMTNISFLATNTVFDRIFITAFDSNNTSLGFTQFNNYKGTYAIPQNTAFVIARIGMSASTVGTEYKTKFMLYEGTTEKTYEPYVGNQASPNPSYPQTIHNVTGNTVVKAKSKNILNINTTNIIVNNSILTVQENGIDVITKVRSSSSTNGFFIYDLGLIENYRGKTLTFSIDEANSKYASSRFINLDADGGNRTNLGNATLTDNRYTTYTVNETYSQTHLGIRFYVSNVAIDETYIFKKPMVEISSTPTTYAQFGENSVTFPLAQNQKLMLGDTLEANKICHKRKQIDKTFINSNITSVTEITDYVRIRINLGASNYSINTPNGLCNYFKFKADFSGQSNHFYAQNTSIYFIVSKTLLTSYDTAGAIAFFNTIPDIIAEYDLATETTEAYTSTQQTAYDNLKEMQSYYDLTYVEGSSADAKPIITAHAKKSLKVMNDEIQSLLNA